MIFRSTKRHGAFHLLLLHCLGATVCAQTDLRETKPLTFKGDLAERMLDGAHRFLDQKLANALARDKTVPGNREELARILGVTDKRLPFRAPSLVNATSQPAKVGSGPGYDVLTVRWPTLEGVFGEGLLLQPMGRKPVADVVAIPDADQSPESFVGLTPGTTPRGQFARRLAASGCRVVVPTLINRTIRGHSERRKRTQLSNREFLQRPAFLMGRTLQGLEIQKILALVDWFAREGSSSIGLVGWGE
ncbi:MAG: hypothetical protein VB997_08090, partial [Opitutales bacterium]